jgi:hypothetical protein
VQFQYVHRARRLNTEQARILNLHAAKVVEMTQELETYLMKMDAVREAQQSTVP